MVNRSHSLGTIVVISFMLIFMSVPCVHSARKKRRFSQALKGLNLEGHVHTIGTHLSQDFKNGSTGDTGAVDVNSLELGMTAAPVKPVDAKVTLLMEEELDSGRPSQDFDVDQAYVVLAGNNRVLVDREARRDYETSPLYAKAGKFYVPFGTNIAYHTFDVISEPQTLSLAETLESAFQIGYTPSRSLNVYAGTFSGDGTDFENGSAEDNDVDDFFAGIDLSNGYGSVSVQWMNNLNNSITLTEEIDSDTPARNVGGISVYGDVRHGPAWLQVAYVSALNEYERGSLTNNSATDQPKPSAITTEMTYNGIAKLFDRPVHGTLVYEWTDEWLNHPENVYGLVLDVPVFRGVTGSIEYIQRDYDPDFSTGLDDGKLLSFRLAVEFEELLGET